MSDEITTAMLQQMQEIEQKDEGQIMAELAGQTVEEWVYEVTRYDRKKKQEVRSAKLSWVGTREVARSRGNIILEEPVITETEKDWRIVVRATDLKRNFSVFGGCHQPKSMTVKEEDSNHRVIGEKQVDDPYSFQKGLSKAQRNALSLCIPGNYVAKMIDRFLVASGRKPLMITEGGPGPQQPARSQIKPKAEWEKVEAVSNQAELERLAWDLAKLQPRELWKELGYGGRPAFMSPEQCWQAFLTLKANKLGS